MEPRKDHVHEWRFLETFSADRVETATLARGTDTFHLFYCVHCLTYRKMLIKQMRWADANESVRAVTDLR